MYSRDTELQQRNPGKSWVFAVLAVVSAMISLAAIVVLQQFDSRTKGELVTIQDLLEKSEEHVGEQVVVSGEVSRVVSPQLFSLGGEGFLYDQELVVVRLPAESPTPEKLTAQLEPGDVVLIRGEVFSVEELLTRVGIESSSVLRQTAGQVVLRAEEIFVSHRTATPAAVQSDL